MAGDTLRAVSKWKHMLKHWERDLPGLTDEELRERLDLARRYESSSMRKGMGRNPKAARLWRDRKTAVEAEIARRAPHT